MPNHCHNRVTFYSDDTTAIQRLHSIFLKGVENNDEVDTGSVFGHFVPEPARYLTKHFSAQGGESDRC